MTLPAEKFTSVEAVTGEIIGLLQAEIRAANADLGVGVEQVINVDHLSADTVLLEVGLDSLKVMSIVFKIEARFDIELDEEDSDDLRTVGDLAALVVRRVEESA